MVSYCESSQELFSKNSSAYLFTDRMNVDLNFTPIVKLSRSTTPFVRPFLISYLFRVYTPLSSTASSSGWSSSTTKYSIDVLSSSSSPFFLRYSLNLLILLEVRHPLTVRNLQRLVSLLF